MRLPLPRLTAIASALVIVACASAAFAVYATTATPSADHAGAPVADPVGPPVARVAVVTDTYHGTRVDDPYRWMEDQKSPEFVAWMRGQADWSSARLAALPERAAILARLEEVTTAVEAVNDIRYRGDRVFYLRRGKDEQEASLFVRDTPTGPERRLVDPNAGVAGDTHWSIADWMPSPDGTRVAYQIAAGGSEQTELRVIDVADGKDAGLRIPRSNFSNGGAWLPDGSGLFYAQFPEAAPGAPPSAKFQKIRAYLHRFGADGPDKAVFGYEVDPAIPDGIDMEWYVSTPADWNGLALARMRTGVSPEKAWWVAPVDTLDDERVPWRAIVPMSAMVSAIDVHDGQLYAVTSTGAPRYRLVRTPLANPDFATAAEVFPQTDAVIIDLVAQEDALYVQTLDTGTYRLWRVDYATGERTPVATPFPGSYGWGEQAAGSSGLSMVGTSWNAPRTHFRVDAAGVATPTGLIPPHPVSLSEVAFVDAEATSHDGTKVPLVIVHRRGHVRDGKAPTIVNAYGAYGIENTSPFYDTRMLPWIERGGVYVWAGVRGGGEHGDAWHRAGQKATKPNTWKDAIAVAEYLVAEGWTAPAHLAVHGGSAGGILVSNAITERPDLFRAALLSVGMTNAIRSETTANGLPNVPEFGSVADEAGFRALLAMDGYQKVKDGTAYPAVLLDTGINDPRVEPWMSAKMAARLQAATTSGRPVWLRVDYDAGHGIGSTRLQRNQLIADQFAFVLAQTR